MSNEALQLIFSLFSFVGVVGILFYLILQKTKSQRLEEKVEELEEEIRLLKEHANDTNETNSTKPQSNANNESVKEKIIELYEQGADAMLIENRLGVPKATIDMVLKFHEMNKNDNWRDSVN
jgi:hypothetical protein